MKLTEENIAFIDSYLKNSGVRYIDVRYEMTDHIATALEEREGGFYENFRQYMLENKKSLLKSNTGFVRSARNRAVKLLVKNMAGSRFAALFATVFFTALLLKSYFLAADIVEGFSMIFNLIIIFVAAVYGYNFYKSEKVFSVADWVLKAPALVLYYLSLILRPNRLIDNEMVLLLYYCFLLAFTVEAFITHRQLMIKYKMQFKG